MKVKEIMTSNLVSANLDMTLIEAARLMKEENIGLLPVNAETDGLAGVITDRDITCRAVAQGLDPSTTQVKNIMSRDVFYCLENEDVEDATHLMEDEQIRRLPVRNERKEIVGILTMADVARRVSRELSGETIQAISQASSRAHRQVAAG